MKNRLLYSFLAVFIVPGILKSSSFGSPPSGDSGCSTPTGAFGQPWPFNKEVEIKQRVPTTRVQPVVVPPKELTKLHDAVNSGDVDEVKTLLVDTLNVDVVGKKGIISSNLDIPLHNVDVADKYGVTPLHIAVIRNQPDVVRTLLEKKHSAENLNEALYYARDKNNVEIIEMLKIAGAFVPVEPNLSTFHVAARIGHQETVSDCIAQNKNLYERGKKDNITPIDCAIEQDKTNIIQQFLENGMKPRWGIGSAVKYNKPEILSTILAIESQNNDKPCSYFNLFDSITRDRPQLSILEELIKSGADVNMNGSIRTPLLGALLTKNPEYVRVLLDNGARVDNKPGLGSNYLEMAIRSGKPEIVKMLVDAGIDVNQSGDFDISPLHNAVDSNDTEMVTVLLASGARLVSPDNRDSELSKAVKNDNLEMVKRLVEAGANVNKKEKDGTILAIAKRKNNPELVEYLVSKGAKTSFFGR